MPGQARVIEIQERGQRVFSRTDLFDPLGRSLVFPEVRDLNAVEITDAPDGVRLMALGLIGYLPLTAAITLNIVPKFPIQNLWTMLEIGGETYANVLPIIRRYQTSSSPAPIQMLARSFVCAVSAPLILRLQPACLPLGLGTVSSSGSPGRGHFEGMRRCV